MKKAVLYLAYGLERIFKETIVSIESLYRIDEHFMDKDMFVLVYTDRIDLFKDIQNKHKNIYIEYLSEQRVKDWLNGQDNLFNLKISVLEDSLKRFGALTLFIDADTVFMESPEKLFEILLNPENLILHYCENSFGSKEKFMSENSGPSYQPGLREYAFLKNSLAAQKVVAGKKEIPISSDTKLWNSGVIGIQPEKISLLNDVKEICSSIYSSYDIGIAEQYAFNLVFGTTGEIHSAESVVLHYWFLKELRLMYEAALFGNYSIENQDNYKQSIVESIRVISNQDPVEFSDVIRYIPGLVHLRWKKAIKYVEFNMKTPGVLRDLLFSEKSVSESNTLLASRGVVIEHADR